MPKPEELPQDQYDKQRYKALTLCDPEVTQAQSEDAEGTQGNRWEITDTQCFVEELLKLSLAEGFQVDLVTPNSVEVLNCTSLRLVKC